MGLKLLVYGENVSYEYGGYQKEETYSAKEQFKNDVVKRINWNEWLDDDITMKDLNIIKQPTLDEVNEAGLEPIYLSYFVKWDTLHNYEVAKRHGFRHMEHEWVREGTIENYNQIDSPAYLINMVGYNEEKQTGSGATSRRPYYSCHHITIFSSLSGCPTFMGLVF